MKNNNLKFQSLTKSILVLLVSNLLLICTLNSQVISTFPHIENFETSGEELTADFPNGWIIDRLSTPSQFNLGWVIIENQANSGIKSAFIPGIPSTSNNDWIISPPIAVKANYSYKFSFWYRKGALAAPNFFFHLGNQPSQVGMDKTPMWSDTNVETTEYKEVIVDYTTNVNDTIYLGFHALTVNPAVSNLLLDDISIEEMASTSLASDLSSHISLEIYPNPASSILNISANSSLDYFEIFNIHGDIILSGKIDSGDVSIDVSHLNNGTYIMRTYSEKRLNGIKKFLLMK